MRTFLTIVGGAAALIVSFVGWRIVATVVGGARAYTKRMERIRPVEDALKAGRDPDAADLLAFARNRETRQVLCDALKHHDKRHLFPEEFRTQQSMAEADLVGWLMHPNELAAPPDDIELMATLPQPHGDGRYFVFRYRTKEPHWAAKDGWLAGVAGPYDINAEPQSSGPGTFSRFEKFEMRTPEEHVAESHRLVIDRRS